MQYIISYYIFFKEQLCVLFSPIDLFYYFMYKIKDNTKIKIKSSKNQYFIFHILKIVKIVKWHELLIYFLIILIFLYTNS